MNIKSIIILVSIASIYSGSHYTRVVCYNLDNVEADRADIIKAGAACESGICSLLAARARVDGNDIGRVVYKEACSSGTLLPIARSGTAPR